MTIPRDRGEKYVAPQILPGEDTGSAWSKVRMPGETIIRARRRSRLARKGEAHELIRKLDPEKLRELARP